MRVALAMAGRRGGGVFSVGVTGSSVTAGHGGFGDAAWPLVLERRLAPVWRRHFGVRFVVHNQAVGGRDPWPASWCLGAMMGADVDIVMREWEYWGAADGLVVGIVVEEGVVVFARFRGGALFRDFLGRHGIW